MNENLGLILDTNRLTRDSDKQQLIGGIPPIIYNIRTLFDMNRVGLILIMVKTKSDADELNYILKRYIPYSVNDIRLIVMEDLPSYQAYKELYEKGNSQRMFELFLFFPEAVRTNIYKIFMTLHVAFSHIITITSNSYFEDVFTRHFNTIDDCPDFLIVCNNARKESLHEDRGVITMGRTLYKSIQSVFTASHFSKVDKGISEYAKEYIEDTAEEFKFRYCAMESSSFGCLSSSNINNPFEYMPCKAYVEAYKNLFKENYLSYID